MLKYFATLMVSRGERRTGVSLDYARQIARTDFALMVRYGKVFSFLDPNRETPALAYHTARLRGAIAADCGTCVEAEVNLAKRAGISVEIIHQVLSAQYVALPQEIQAVARLSDAVVGRREDDDVARQAVQSAYGDAGLIELGYAMNGAALLPGIKRAMGYATTCDINVLRLKN